MAGSSRLVVVAVAVCLVVPLKYKLNARDDQPIARLASSPKVRRMLESIRQMESETIRNQIRLCEIPAPSFGEQARGDAYAAAMRQAGLSNVRTDAVGNIIGELAGRASRPRVVLSAHLDTVFPAHTPVAVTREGTRLTGPGIGDDCRGLAVVLSVARSFVDSGLELDGSVAIVGTVGEEGLGDLRGVRALTRTLAGPIDGFISVDGVGHVVTNVGVASRRFRVTFRGPGGHSYEDFGQASPINAAGFAVGAISRIPLPARPKTTVSVGRIGGGTSINAIAAEAWLEVDIRSTGAEALDRAESLFRAAVRRALEDENRRRSGGAPLTVVIEAVGNRPGGRTAADAPIVTTALAALASLGLPARLGEASTDANYPMSVGIPSVTVGGGGRGSQAHTLDEWFDSTDSWKGTQMVALLTLGLVGDLSTSKE